MLSVDKLEFYRNLPKDKPFLEFPEGNIASVLIPMKDIFLSFLERRYPFFKKIIQTHRRLK
jgi:hypothetical protein